MASCRSCGAMVVWAETEARPDKPGRKMPLDATPGPAGAQAGKYDDGNLLFTGQSTGDGTSIIRYVKKGRGLARSHFATCANPAAHRKQLRK